MARLALRIEVTKKDRKELKKLLRGGVRRVRVIPRVMASLQKAKKVSAPRIALTPQAIRRAIHRDVQEGLERAAALLEDSQKQRIIAVVCSDPPEGCARWRVRPMAEEAVKRA